MFGIFGPPPERAILAELIAELREVHRAQPYGSMLPGEFCVVCHLPWPCKTVRAADQAETSLG